MKEMNFMDKDKDHMRVEEGYGRATSSIYFKTAKDGCFLSGEEAVGLARSILLHFGAPLEEPKPEPKAGQMWQSEWGKMKCIVVRVESGISLLTHENGTWSNADKAILHTNYKFVSESWAEEETE